MLNQLTPQERRIVVAIGMVVIVVLNMLFVWPHFGEWKRIRNELQSMRSNIEKFNKQIALDINPTNGLQKQLQKLVHQEGTGVMDEQVQLQKTIGTQARKVGVNVANYNPGQPRPDTNGFFEEETIKINVDSQEPELVSFLYNIGGDPAMIRVSELELSPQDQNRYRLRGSITLTANYAKRAPKVGAAAPAKPSFIPGSKPGGSPGVSIPPAPNQRQNRTNTGPQRLKGPQIPGQSQPGQRGPPGPNSAPRTPFVPARKTSG